MQSKLFVTASLVISLILIAVISVPAHAIESFGIGAIPADPQANNPRTKSIFIYEAGSGKVITDAIKVTNNTDQTKTISVYPVDSQRSSDGAFACAQAADTPKEVGSWIVLAKNEVTLAPRTNETVPFTLTMPDRVDAGEHNGCIAIQAVQPPSASGTNGIVLSFRSALRVAITVPGNLTAKLSFKTVSTKITDNKLQISPELKNEGNVSLDTNVTVGLQSLFGQSVASTGGDFSVLSNTDARFNFEVPKPYWGGWYQRLASANYHALHQDGTSEAADKKLSFTPTWVFIMPQPGAITIEVVTAVIILAALGFILWRRYQHQQLLIRTSKHTVQPGENIQNLAKIAHVSWRRLAKLNHLKTPYALTPGQTILLPKANHRSTASTITRKRQG